MHRLYRALVSGLSLILVISACSSFDHAETVEDAVQLLQDLEDNNVWATLDDGLTALDEQSGYRASLQMISDTAGDNLTLEALVDGEQHALIDVQRGTEMFQVALLPTDDTIAPYTVLQVTDEQTYCRATGAHAELFRAGLSSVLEDAVHETLGLTTLGVIDTPEDDADSDITLLERDATRYDIESRLADAIAILDTVDHAELAALRAAAGDFALSGELVLDDDTAALLHFANDYTAAGTQSTITFTVTQWGVAEAISLPVDLDSLEPCP